MDTSLQTTASLTQALKALFHVWPVIISSPFFFQHSALSCSGQL